MASSLDKCPDSDVPPERSWGTISPYVSNADMCLQDCRRRFLKKVVPGFDNSNETLLDLCETLTTLSRGTPGANADIFGPLFCCDSVRCGVRYTLENEVLASDPNVDGIIAQCLDRGYRELPDPRPPTLSYRCPYDSVYAPGEPGPCKLAGTVAGSTARSGSSQTINTLSTIAQSTGTASSPTGIMTASSKTPNPSQEDDDPAGMSTGVKVAITISSIMGILAVVGLALWLRRRRNHKSPCSRGFSARRANFKGDDSMDSRSRSRSRTGNANNPATNFEDYMDPSPNPSPMGSPTRLVTVPYYSVSPPAPRPESLTPPLRLRDRKLLPTGPAPQHQVVASQHSSGPFPTSPICSPTTSILVPRTERHPRIHGMGRPAPTSSTTGRRVHSEGNSRCASHASTESGRSSNSAATTATVSRSTQTTPISPTRPPRPHEGTLDITDLTTPNVPPAAHLATGTHGDVGVAMGVVNHNPAQGVVLQRDSRALCDLTEEYARETRDSWGSWGGGCGGGPGPSSGSLNTARKGKVTSPILGEEELERMGGRYH